MVGVLVFKLSVNYIREFCFSGEGIYQTLLDNSGIENSEIVSLSTTNEKVIYNLGWYDYAVSINNDNSMFYSSSDDFISVDDLAAVLQKVDSLSADSVDDRSDDEKLSYYEGFFTSSTITNSGEYKEVVITGADSFIPSTMSALRTSGGYTGNCAPTACTNLLSYYKEQRDFTDLGTSRQDIYNEIVKQAGWDENGTEGMTASKAKSAMKKVVKNAGYSFSSSTYWFNWWSDWTRDLGNDYPVYTSIRGYKYTDGSWTEVGHAIVAVGYRKYDDAKYLRVYDGWNSTNDKYIWFDSDYFKSVKGIKIEVS